MAKQNTILIKLVSTADTGYYYVTKKNPRTSTEKLEFRKYDPVARKHVAFREAKIKWAGRPGPDSRKPPFGRLFRLGPASALHHPSRRRRLRGWRAAAR